MTVRSPTAASRGVAEGAAPMLQRKAGTSASTGSFLVVAGSPFLHPSNIWERRGRSFSEPRIFVGFSPTAREIVWPTAVSAVETV